MADSARSNSSSDDIAGLLGDVDQLDEQLFSGGAKPKRVSFSASTNARPTSGQKAKGLDNLDALFGEKSKVKEEKASLDSILSSSTAARLATTNNTIGNPKVFEKRSAITDNSTSTKSVINPSSTSPTKSSSIVDTVAQHSKPETSKMDDLFGPTNRRKPINKNIPTSEWTKDDNVEQRSTPIKTNTTDSTQLPFLLTSNEQPKTKQTEAIPSQNYEQLTINRLEREIDRLNDALDQLRKVKKIDEQTIIDEWKEKIQSQRNDHIDEIERIKTMHRKTIDEINDNHQQAIDRLKSTIAQEIAIVNESHQQSKNYEQMTGKVQSAVDRLSYLSDNLSEISERTAADKTSMLIAREEHVRHMQLRVENELKELAIEKDKLHSILITLETTAKEQEKLLEQEKWQIRQDETRFIAMKTAFREEQISIVQSIDQKRQQLDAARESFLAEQHDLLSRILVEQERIEHDRSTFNLQRDRDIVRLRNEAFELQQKMDSVQRNERLMTQIRNDLDAKQKKLAQYEQTLEEECLQLENVRKDVERTRLIADDELARIRSAIDMDEVTSPTTIQWPHTSSNNQHQIQTDENNSAIDDWNRQLPAERPYVESPREPSALFRHGSLRSVLRHHAKLLEKYIDRNGVTTSDQQQQQ